MARGIKKKDYENITDTSVRKVIALLSDEKPITKKEACEILNISYNTTRLNKIIEDYHTRQSYIKKRKEQLRGKPASQQEIAAIVLGYLKGESMADISKSSYRSVAFCKNVIESVGVPSRNLEEDKWKAEALPDQCVATQFDIGDIVWSARYHTAAIIKNELNKEYIQSRPGYSQETDYEAKYGSKCYQIYVLTQSDEDSLNSTNAGFYAVSAAYDLGSLEHLKKFNIDLTTI